MKIIIFASLIAMAFGYDMAFPANDEPQEVVQVPLVDVPQDIGEKPVPQHEEEGKDKNGNKKKTVAYEVTVPWYHDLAIALFAAFLLTVTLQTLFR